MSEEENIEQESILELGDMDLDDSVEPTVMAAGEEHKLRIREASFGDGAKGKYLKIRLESVDNPYAKEFNTFLTLPNAETQDAKTLNAKRNALKKCMQAFGLDTGTTLPVSEMVDLEAWAILGIEENEQFGEQNFVRQWMVPQE